MYRPGFSFIFIIIFTIYIKQEEIMKQTMKFKFIKFFLENNNLF